MFAVRNHQNGIQRLVAACDEELVGSKHADGALRLDVDAGFYDGMRVEVDALRGFLRQCTMANVVGERAVQVAIDLGLVDPAHVATIDGVPHAQFIAILP